MKIKLCLYCILSVIGSGAPALTARAGDESWYIARSPDDECFEAVQYHVTIGTKGYGYLGMSPTPCKGTGALPHIGGKWKKHESPNTGRCYWTLQIKDTRGAKGYGYLGMANTSCDG